MTDGITVEAASFQLVRDSERFPLRNVKEEELPTIYGRPGNVHIYTGKVTVVGDNHVECDLNAFTSCSGSIVFLLDKQQPESVTTKDYGKVIAVHAGAHPTLTNRNIAFRIRPTDLPLKAV